MDATIKDEPLDSTRLNEPSASNRQTELYNKLRAVKTEIDAVASTIEHVNIGRNEDRTPDGNDRNKQEGLGKGKGPLQPSSNVSTLQQALAADRLQSLRKTKAQLEESLVIYKDDSSKSKHEKLLQDLVKEQPQRKRQPKEDPKLSNNRKKRQKAVSFDDDEEFDAVLNAASTGFVETVS